MGAADATLKSFILGYGRRYAGSLYRHCKSVGSKPGSLASPTPNYLINYVCLSSTTVRRMISALTGAKMTRAAILKKLDVELQEDITTERHVVYILTEIRKLLEHLGNPSEFYALDFYCSLALHVKMTRSGAMRILERFDKAYPILAKDEQLPAILMGEIDRTIALRTFERQLAGLLKENELPLRLFTEPDAWPKFVKLYASIIHDCELVLEGSDSKLQHINRVVVRLGEASQIIETPFGNQALFTLRWICHGKDGKSSEHYVIFGYDPK